MTKFTKINIQNIPIEDAHGGSGRRQMLINPSYVASQHWEAVTKGFLEKGGVFDWHNHPGVDEMFIVLKGSGKLFCEDEVVEYLLDDVISIPADLKHKIEALEDSEFYFIRVKV